MKDILLTKQRKVLLEVLNNLKHHPTAEEIYDEIKKHYPKVSLASVYRNLDLLSENGRIKKLETGQPQKRYDSIIDQHYHIMCVICGKLEDIHMKPFEDVEKIVEHQTNYKVLSHNFRVNGICADCIAKGLMTQSSD